VQPTAGHLSELPGFKITVFLTALAVIFDGQITFSVFANSSRSKTSGSQDKMPKKIKSDAASLKYA